MRTLNQTAKIPRTLILALRTHCKRSGVDPNRVIAASLLKYLRSDLQDKVDCMRSLYDWRLERLLRAQWRDAERPRLRRRRAAKLQVH